MPLSTGDPPRMQESICCHRNAQSYETGVSRKKEALLLSRPVEDAGRSVWTSRIFDGVEVVLEGNVS